MNTNELLQMATAIRDEIKTASITPERLGTLLVGLVSAIGAGGSSSGGDKADVLGTVANAGGYQAISSIQTSDTIGSVLKSLTAFTNNGRFSVNSDETGLLIVSRQTDTGGVNVGLRLLKKEDDSIELRGIVTTNGVLVHRLCETESNADEYVSAIMEQSKSWPLIMSGEGSGSGNVSDVLKTALSGFDPSQNYLSASESTTVLQAFNILFGRLNDGKKMRVAISPSGFVIGLEKKAEGTISTIVLFDLKGSKIWWKSNNSYDTTMMSDVKTIESILKSEGTSIQLGGSSSGGDKADVLGTVLSGFGDTQRQSSVKDTSTVLQAISTLSYLVNNGRFKTVSDGTGFLLLSSSEAEGTGTVSGLRVTINDEGDMELRASKLEGATGSKSWFMMGDETIMGISAQWPLVSGGGIGIKNVTFDELKAAVEAGTLETGYRYRLIDYECKTSSGHPVEQHPFNIVFEAVSPNNLSEYACAERKEDDEYYTSNDLSKWKIKFSFDAAGYDWVTADSGFKGVIYYMKDEYGNSAGYDFKQIKVGNTSRLSNIYYKDGLAGNKSKVAQAVADMLYSSASDIIVCGQRYGSSSISGDYKKAGVSGGASVLPSSSQYVKLFGESENAIVAAVANTAVGVGESTSVYTFGGDTENDYSISGITRNCHVEGHGPRGNVFKNVCTNCSIGENVSNSVLSGDYITVDGNSVGNILFGDRLAVHDGNLCHVLGNSSGIEIESSTDVAIGPSCDGCSASSVSFAGIGGNCGNVAVSDMEIFLCNGICVDLDISGIDSLIIGANSSGIRSLGSSFTQVNEIPAYSKGIVIMNRTQPLSYSELGFVPSETECLQNLLVTDGDAAGVLSDLTELTDTYFKILRGSSIIPSRPDSELSGTSENPVQNKAIKAALDKKQDTLVSGTNMKTLNGLSLLGAGGIVIEDKQLYTVYGNVPEGNTIIPGQIWVIEQDPDSAMSSIITVNKVNISSSVGEQKVSLMDSYIYASDNINFVFNAASVLNFAVYKKDFGNPPGKGGKRKYTLNWVMKGTSQFVVIDCENFE